MPDEIIVTEQEPVIVAAAYAALRDEGGYFTVHGETVYCHGGGRGRWASGSFRLDQVRCTIRSCKLSRTCFHMRAVAHKREQINAAKRTRHGGQAS